MCKFRPGSGNFLGFSGETKNVGKTMRYLRNAGSKFLISYFLNICLLDFLVVAGRIDRRLPEETVKAVRKFPEASSEERVATRSHRVHAYL